MNVWTNECMNEWMNECMNEWMNGIWYTPCIKNQTKKEYWKYKTESSFIFSLSRWYDIIYFYKLIEQWKSEKEV